MPAYHQMGHDSRNLLAEPHLARFKGAILSPVNSPEAEVADIVHNPPTPDFEFIFDPQLYFPTTDRGALPNWSYFPSDVDTADQSSLDWWASVTRKIAECTARIGPHAVCSPAIVPRAFNLDYYAMCQQVTRLLQEAVAGQGAEILQTLLVRLADLATPTTAPEITSLITASDTRGVYLVMLTDTPPRRELSEVDSLKGAIRLIQFLEQSETRVLVGFASSDVVLWKAAGATSVATGKFFNLRRFTPSRWEPPPEGGGQVPYWFEESVMAFLRESDVARLRQAGCLSPASLSNPYAMDILAAIDAVPPQPWLGLSWRQYMYWFVDFEARIHTGRLDPSAHLASADGTWKHLDLNTILMEERSNDGTWVRAWRRVLAEAFR
jgi:hypothetical protein